ncbi:hypothetical protein KO537_19345 [Shewanella sp. NKUCC01_JLK]|uniref:hypothetical protein n=1 Tax=Shewanella sp. NKUCC01_JLK TaxID=2842123 RepID=UPI001C5A7AF8|nr:hypothetical protein [Shewanella sp. NKUCC01_JLK]MBW3516845.1 hypothetical protein [Shewanella sp. NKUCC01_JLK]
MSQHCQIIAELGSAPRPVFNGRHPAGLRSDGLPYASRCKVSAAKRARTRRIEDMALAKELGINLEELQGGAL